MISIFSIIFLVSAYLIGSIPFSIIASKALKGIDVREYGSGNAGATNTFRVLGKKAGTLVLILDVLKGYSAVSLAMLTDFPPISEVYANFQLAFGIAAVLGHVFPIYAGFRGGKGVATLLGFMIAVFPLPSLVSILVFLFVLLLSKYVSLSSIISGIVFPFSVWFLSDQLFNTMLVFSIFVPIILIATHQQNIERLMNGVENKIGSKKK
jgi:glycerol-3-phosphate acyltransferase PlsY